MNWCQRDIFQNFSRIQSVWALKEWNSGAGPPAEQLPAMESISQSVPRDLLVHLSLSCTTLTSTPLSSLSSSSFSVEAASVKPPCPLVLVQDSLVLPAKCNYWLQASVKSMSTISLSRNPQSTIILFFPYKRLRSTSSKVHLTMEPWQQLMITFPFCDICRSNFSLNSETSKDGKVKYFNSPNGLMNGRTQISN